MSKGIFLTLKSYLGQWKYRLQEESSARFGTFRQQEQHGLLLRPNYAYGMLKAADLARYLKLKEVTICEFGVATGNGLLAMIDLAEKIKVDTGISFRIVGFDTGEGLPEIGGYEDHPEHWSAGDFTMFNKEELMQKITGRAELFLGDIKDTVGSFVSTLLPDSPLGFISIDVDIYSATRSALKCLQGSNELYLPAISMYFDDVVFFFANRWCGELRAIEEFNLEDEYRKIDHDYGLIRRTVVSPKQWHSQMFVAHILDHEFRSHAIKREAMDLNDHFQFMKQFNLL